jgi:hypothetical protein
MQGGVVTMSNHQASEQMLGYLYQVRYALYLLLKNSDDQAQISIERFDDIAFSNDDTPEILIQLKHHVKAYGDLNNASTDMWRTINVWIDAIRENPSLIDSTKFVIITTATAPVGTAAHHLKTETSVRDSAVAYDLLQNTANESKNKDHKGYYTKFNSLSEAARRSLVDRIIVIDKENTIANIEQDIKDEIKYCCLPKHSNLICERLEGWWFQKSIEALGSDIPIFMAQSQVRSYIVSVSQEYTADNLPIDPAFDIVDLSDLDAEEKIFHEQLKLICLGNNRLQIAVRDYYRAFQQRANWVRNDLLYVNELDDYEKRLVDEWEHAFSEMQDDLSDYGDEITEDHKIKSGKILFSSIDKKDIRIRPLCSEAFIMRGSYHILANQLKVGWHVDFYNRLKALLGK